MKAGHVMETKDGQKIIMVGNELARLEMIKAEKRGN
ncbi:MAG: CopK family periplasmic copper-binding protein [Aquabacterium sp.]|nr:CopK family periplasmic copper-binding protein [Aquabacterium sp.]